MGLRVGNHFPFPLKVFDLRGSRKGLALSAPLMGGVEVGEALVVLTEAKFWLLGDGSPPLVELVVFLKCTRSGSPQGKLSATDSTVLCTAGCDWS